MRNIVLLVTEETTEAFTSIKHLCKLKNYSYNYLKNKKPPFIYKSAVFIRLATNTKLPLQANRTAAELIKILLK